MAVTDRIVAHSGSDRTAAASPIELAHAAALVARQLGTRRALDLRPPFHEFLEPKWRIQVHSHWPEPGSTLSVQYRGYTVLRATGEEISPPPPRTPETEYWRPLLLNLARLAEIKAGQSGERK